MVFKNPPAAPEVKKPNPLKEKPFDYIERTRPEDPSDRAGQKTRDNVNPAIPSNKREGP